MRQFSYKQTNILPKGMSHRHPITVQNDWELLLTLFVQPKFENLLKNDQDTQKNDKHTNIMLFKK